MTGKEGEIIAAAILPGEAIRRPQNHGADVYWQSQDAWVEVKTTTVQPHELGKRWLRFDLRRNWLRNDYYMLMVATQDSVGESELHRAYLIPSQELAEHLGKSRTLSIPHDRITFKWEHKRIV